MRIRAFSARPDEDEFFDRFSREYGHDLVKDPRPLNIQTAADTRGFEGLSIVQDGYLTDDVMQVLIDNGVKYLALRTIGYDGINVNKIKKRDLRKSLGLVLQETNLFTGTVMENIRYGRLSATDEECREAARLSGADDFITRLPEGYDTLLTNNGTNLSQGQRQLIAIARAAVADPPVMILDEATSSIDTRTESIVQRGMDKLMEGRTVFVIAHRLSTVMNSDVIMVLDHGKIIERGTHDELIAKKGTYYQLYTGAFELE